MHIVAEILNFALSFVFWATLGRVMLTLITRGRDNFFLGVLRKPTEPFYKLVRLVAPERLVPVGVLLLVFALRLALLPFLRPPA